MAGFAAPSPLWEFRDPLTDTPLRFGTVETYLDGTSTPEPTYADAALTTPNATTIALDAYGRCTMWFDDAKEYKLIAKRENGTTVDTINDVRSPGASASAAVDQLREDLADTTDDDLNAGLISVKQSDTGAIAIPLLQRLRNVVYSDEFILPSSHANATAGMNKFFAAAARAGMGILLPGNYYCGELIVPSNVCIMGYNPETTRIIARTDLATNKAMVTNTTLTGTVDTYPDKNITFTWITFDGNGNSGRAAELLSFLKVRGLRINRCHVTNHRYMGIALGGCKDSVIADCEFDYCGKTDVTAEGGAAIWLGSAGDGSKTYDTVIDSVYAHDNEWSVMYANAHRTTVIKPNFINNKESAIFANNTCYDLTVSGGRIVGTTKKNISASGIEFGGSVATFGDGLMIRDIADTGIVMTDAQGVTINGVTSINCRRDASSFPTGAHIAIVTTQTAPNQPKWITIGNVTAFDASSPSYAGIVIGNSGAAVENVSIQSNNLSGTAWSSGEAIVIADGKWGSGCIRKNNAGSNDASPKLIESQTPNSTGVVAYTGFGFKPSRIEIYAVVAGSPQRACESWVDATGNGVCHFWAADGSAGVSSTVGNKAINIADASATNQIVANWVSMDDDGFTLNFTTASVQAYAAFVAYP